ncbi:MAG: lamin tail domain-containing protein, partial [Candidatus Kapabacteria bacterium]|nr:lamin tail domain-containing protein [Candidatus Kapabacteria bacterium]
MKKLAAHIILIIFFFGCAEQAAAQVLINEFMSSNTKTIHDSYGESSDWIELYNNSDSLINLAGFGLSDDEAEPYKWVFPDSTIISPKQWLLIFASGRDGNSAIRLHCNFK